MLKPLIATFAHGAVLLLFVAAALSASPARADIKTVLINSQGATAPASAPSVLR